MNDYSQQPAFDFVENELPAWASQIVVFDTETTGLDLSTARIVTAGLAELDSSGRQVGPAREWLANPGIEIPESASNVHGVTTQMASQNGRQPEEVVSEILEALRGYLSQGIPVVAYNAPYDFTILHNEALRYGLQPLQNPWPILDPLVMDKYADQFRKGKRKLKVTAEFYGVELADAHNATADAIAAGQVLQAIARKWASKFPSTLEEIHAGQVAWSLSQEESFAKYMRQNVNADFVTNFGWPLKLSN